MVAGETSGGNSRGIPTPVRDRRSVFLVGRLSDCTVQVTVMLSAPGLPCCCCWCCELSIIDLIVDGRRDAASLGTQHPRPFGASCLGDRSRPFIPAADWHAQLRPRIIDTLSPPFFRPPSRVRFNWVYAVAICCFPSSKSSSHTFVYLSIHSFRRSVSHSPVSRIYFPQNTK